MTGISCSQLLNDIRAKSKAINSAPLIQREFISINQDDGNISDPPSSKGDDVIRIMQWNMLAQGLCQTSDGFMLCPNKALDWTYRQFHILEELLSYTADIYFLEELDQFAYINEYLGNLGFTGVFFPKPDSPCLYEANNYGSDGCAIFWRKSHFKLLEQENCILLNDEGKKTNQVALLCKFQAPSGKHFLCAATHLKSKKGFEEYRFQQGKFLESVLRKKAGDLPLILCGDFNAEPTEQVVNVMKSSELGLTSAYTHLSETGSEPPYTTWKVRAGKRGREPEEVCHTIDYIFYTTNKFICLKLLKFPTAAEIGEGFLPSYSYPSDHLSLVADFKLL
ncbi:unnamed protein product [Lymnaea stagnalis]|uniref:Nocturnin n=1 Tax=Lymnaea stagnalis TaxID=6523 RepID=A0AAV2HGD1_LYMST